MGVQRTIKSLKETCKNIIPYTNIFCVALVYGSILYDLVILGYYDAWLIGICTSVPIGLITAWLFYILTKQNEFKQNITRLYILCQNCFFDAAQIYKKIGTEKEIDFCLVNKQNQINHAVFRHLSKESLVKSKLDLHFQIEVFLSAGFYRHMGEINNFELLFHLKEKYMKDLFQKYYDCLKEFAGKRDDISQEKFITISQNFKDELESRLEKIRSGFSN
jgi:hypothetical protein